MAEPVPEHKKSIFTSIWFWIIIISIILIVLAIIIRVVQKVSNYLFWILISVGILGLFIGIILLVEWSMKPSKKAKAEKMAAESQEEAMRKSLVPVSPIVA